MRFGILGPLRLGDGESTVTAGRDRTILAMLLLRAGRVVPVEELIDAVWEERPPATARTQLQICVSRLRQRLALLGLPVETIVTDPVGYGIRITPDDLDAEVFARSVEAGRAAVAAGQPGEARRHYRAALALWRGPALSGTTSRSVRRRALALDEQRLATLEECVDVELRLRRAADLIDELSETVDRHPLRERLRGQLMLALAAAGRQADALAVYREGRRVYAENSVSSPVRRCRNCISGCSPGRGVGRPGERCHGAGPLAAPGDRRLHRPATDGGSAGAGDRGGRGPDPADRRDARQRQDHPGRARGDRPR